MIHSQDLGSGESPVRQALAQRGFLYNSSGDPSLLIRPYYATAFGRTPLPQYELMAKESFRKVLRTLAASGESGADEDELQKLAGESWPTKYCPSLERDAIIRRTDQGRWVLLNPVDDFGPTLECYVAEVCKRELDGAYAEWGVKISSETTGGDYDVLAWLERLPGLVYIECKSGRPRNVDESQVENFLLRWKTLRPELAILLIDADDSLDTVIRKLDSSVHKASRSEYAPDLGSRSTFLEVTNRHVYRCLTPQMSSIFVIDSHPSIKTNVECCLKCYRTASRGIEDWQ
jgi:hypothetical protein